MPELKNRVRPSLQAERTRGKRAAKPTPRQSVGQIESRRNNNLARASVALSAAALALSALALAIGAAGVVA